MLRPRGTSGLAVAQSRVSRMDEGVGNGRTDGEILSHTHKAAQLVCRGGASGPREAREHAWLRLDAHLALTAIPVCLFLKVKVEGSGRMTKPALHLKRSLVSL